MPWISILPNLSRTVSESWNFKTVYMCHIINKPYLSWQLNLFWVRYWHIIKAHLEMYVAQVCDHIHLAGNMNYESLWDMWEDTELFILWVT